MSNLDISLKQLYIGSFGSAPEAENLEGWETALQDGSTLTSAAQDFATRSEMTARITDPGTQDLEAFLNEIYHNLFGRDTDAEGLSFWSGKISEGLPLGTIVLHIIEGASDADKAVLAAKTAQVDDALKAVQQTAELAVDVAPRVNDTQGVLKSGADDTLRTPHEKMPAGGSIAPFELSAVELGTNLGGFVINGVSSGDYSGGSVSSAGDVNGDGLEDVIVSSAGDDPNGSSSGASFVVFGKTNGGGVELSDVQAGIGGFAINGVSARDFSGVSVSTAGDVNNDGLTDLIIGALFDDPNGSNAGSGFVVFGKTDGATVELSDVEASTNASGFVMNGMIATDWAGRSVADAGDVNGDGLDDLIVGAFRDDANGADAGASFVVFGKTDGSLVELDDIQDPTDSGGFVINGATAAGFSGYSVSGAGDVNGDGLDDLIVGAPLDDPNGFNSGTGFVVFGKTDGGIVELSDVKLASNNSGFVINGAGALDNAGGSVSAAGDVNGDGFADLIVGAYRDDPNGIDSGASYVVFGQTNGSIVELSAVGAGMGGFAINGVSATDFAGRFVSGAGDVNGDGLDDLIVGALQDDPNGLPQSGASFVVFGKTGSIAVELSDIEAGTGGFVINGASANDNSARAVSAAGDVNGDGFDDLIVGAEQDDPNGSNSGASFVVFGGSFNNMSATLGTAGNDTLTGTAAADRMIAGRGDDVLVGSGGADVLRSGEGDDVLAVSDLSFADIDGGTGSDTLRLDGSALTLDLAVLDNTSLTGIERIDLNANSNDLILNRIEVQRLSEYTNTLRVLGDAPDTVTVTDHGWVFTGTGSDADGPFNIYINGYARLEISQGIALSGGLGGPVSEIELSDIEMNTDPRGFVINGVSAFDESGRSVSDAGDVNGDGFDDLIIGSRGDDPNGNGSGAGFVVFGQTDGGVIELSHVQIGTNLNGFVINGASAGDYAGNSVSAAGDVNGDGLADLIVGAPGDDPNGQVSGASFVVLAKQMVPWWKRLLLSGQAPQMVLLSTAILQQIVPGLLSAGPVMSTVTDWMI
jgi:hypothetical protein